MLIKTRLKRFRNGVRSYILKKKCEHITHPLKKLLPTLKNSPPVFVISYNNGIYVRNIVTQLNSYNIKPIIFDNSSNCKHTLKTLSDISNTKTAYVIYSKYNFGHMIGFLEPIYNLLPEVFAYTDPDLQMNKNIPVNFLKILSDLTIEYPVYKVGFALPYQNNFTLKNSKVYCHRTKPIKFGKYFSISEFESRHWIYRLKHNSLELYGASIDTTFAMYRKSNFIGDFYSGIRVAGDFSAIHLPWFTELDMFNDKLKASYLKNNKSSTWT